MLQITLIRTRMALVVIWLALAAGVSTRGQSAASIDVVIDEWTVPVGSRPHDPAVAPDGSIWYTDYARGFLGRLDSRTGEVTEFASPGGRTSRPYGMTSTSDGAIWFSESGVEPNTVVRFNPSDGSMQSWPIPSGGGIVRHMVTAPNDDVWLACSGVDRLARVRRIVPS